MAYTYSKSITIDADKVSGTSNLTDFPLGFIGVYDGTGTKGLTVMLAFRTL